MYGDEGIKLLLRSRGRSSRLDTLPQYEDERVSKVVNEISYLASDTENIVAAAQRLGREGEGGGDGSGTPGRDDDDEEENIYLTTANGTPSSANSIKAAFLLHRLAIAKSKRCLLAYHYDRASRMARMARLGRSAELKGTLSPQEQQLVSGLNAIMADYNKEYTHGIMRGGGGGNVGVELGGQVVGISTHKPPQNVFCEIRVLRDVGEIQTENGAIRLARDSQHYVKKTDVQQFIDMGYVVVV